MSNNPQSPEKKDTLSPEKKPDAQKTQASSSQKDAPNADAVAAKSAKPVATVASTDASADALSATGLAAKKIKDSQNREKTLLTGPLSFVKLDPNAVVKSVTQESTVAMTVSSKKKILFLGLGCNAAADALPLCGAAETIYYLEHELFEKSCKTAGVDIAPPKNFTEISESALFTLLGNPEEKIMDWEFVLYKQSTALFPMYWNDFLVRFDSFLATKLKKPAEAKTSRSIFVAGSAQDLVHKEVCDAVTALSYECITPANVTSSTGLRAQSAEEVISNIANALKSKKPTLFLSINGRNLDSAGKMATILKQLKIPIVIWILDNPWNILCGFKQDWWKECIIYITDETYIPMLKAHGAKKVAFLPLAGSTYSMQSVKEAPPSKLLFVGNSAFKDKDKFFGTIGKQLSAPLAVCQKLVGKYFEATENEQKVEIIDYHKIYAYLYPSKQQTLWPGNEFRIVSYLAAECDTFVKSHWLNRLPYARIIGDKEWSNLLEDSSRLQGPVDYYSELPTYYTNAQFTLNITSLLLPSALTQRHFDVWLAGGFLISSPTKGMDIFQSDITALTVARSPEKADDLISKFLKKPSIYQEVKKTMNNIIVTNHFYSHRVMTILNQL